MKPTFARGPRPTGLARVADPSPVTQIKLSKKQIGLIMPPARANGFSGWKISFAVKKDPTAEEPAPFRWITFKTLHESEERARGWVLMNFDLISKKYEIHQFDH